MRTPLNDIELQRLKQEKRRLQPATIQAFDSALEDFMNSVRFGLLKSFQLVHFLDDKTLGVPQLEKLCFAEFGEMSTYEICCLPKVESSHLEKLTNLLLNLSKEDDLTSTTDFLRAEDVIPAEMEVSTGTAASLDDDEELTAHLLGMGPEAPGASAKNRPKEMFSSVEAERMLREAFERLSAATYFDQVTGLRVKDFWNSADVRAPFIESMTVGQLTQMRLRDILEKRTFTDQKLMGILNALDSLHAGYLRVENDVAPGTETIPVSTNDPTPLPQPSACTLNFSRWRFDGESSGSVAAAIVGWCEAESHQATNSRSYMTALTHALPELLSVNELVSLWLSTDLTVPNVAELFGVEQSDFAKTLSGSSKIIAAHFQQHGLAMYSHWQGVLAGPGASERSLIEPYFGGGLSERFIKQLARILLVSLGATKPEIFGHIFSEHWTCNTKLLRAAIQGVVQEFPQSNEKLQQDLKALLPLFEVQELTEALRLAADFDRQRNVWTRKVRS